MDLDKLMETPLKPKGPAKAPTAITKYEPPSYLTSVYRGGVHRRVGDVFLEKDPQSGLDYLAVQTHQGPVPYDAYGLDGMWD